MHIVNSFQELRHRTHCPFAKSANLYLAANWDSKFSVETNLFIWFDTLLNFTHQLSEQNWDGIVLLTEADYGDTLTKLAIFTNTVLRFLSKHDPAKANCMKQNILDKSWQFSFNHVRLFVTTFSTCYPVNHSRYTFDQPITMIFLQPEISFHHKKIPRGSNHRNLRELIRQQFSCHLRSYDSDILHMSIEAYRYVKPLHRNDKPIKWWLYPHLY